MTNFLLNIIQTPPIILAMVALIGLLLQGKNFGEIFEGTIKTALGMLIISTGAGLIVQEILPFVELFGEVFNLQGFATSSEAVVGSLQSNIPIVASTSSIILGVGFLVNILLARITPLKNIFLTGHMMWISSVAIAYCLYIQGYNELTIIILGSILQGLILTMIPSIIQKSVNNLTGNDSFSIGHLTNIGTGASSFIGGHLGNKEDSAEDIKLPKQLQFFSDTSVSVEIVMLFFYLIVVIAAGPERVSELSNGQNYMVFGILKSLGFTAGVLVLLQGVRLFLGEIVPAFKGIADKVVPGARPALDVPVLFALAPNSLMFGFISAVVGMIVGMFLSSFIFNVTPLVSIIGAFFTGGVAGILGNANGGKRGAIISGFLYGLFLILLSALVFKTFDFSAAGVSGVGHDCIDIMIIMLLLKNPIIGIPVLLACYLALCLIERKSTN